jgi:hypothetical protein
MAISTPSETIVSLEDPAALQAALQSGSFTRLTTSTSSPASLTTSAAESTVPLDTTSDPFITTTSDVAVVPVADGTSTQNITFTTGADRSVVIAGITTDQTSTAIVDSVAIYNTDKEIYVTGIDQSTTQNIV